MIHDDDKDKLLEIYDVNRATERGLTDKDVIGVYRGLQEAGWEDSNNLISPSDLHGHVYDLGLYWEMRYSSPIIASVMEFRKASVEALEYKVVSRSDNPCIKAQMAAKAVQYTLENLPYSGLNEFIAQTYDQIYSFGFSLNEMYIAPEGENKGRLQLINIPSFQVEWFDLDPKERSSIKTVRVNLGDNQINVPGEKLVWYGQTIFPHNYWGMSDLRKLLSVFSAKKADLQSYLTLRRLQQGILYLKENPDHPNNANSYAVAKNFLTQYYQGKVSPLILNAGLDINFLDAKVSSVDGFKDTAAYFDALMRDALGASLKNLGIGGAGGAYALGAELAISDAQAFKTHVDGFLKIINGHGAPESNLLEVITEMLGFDRCHTPKIVVVDNTDTTEAENLQLLTQLVKDGLITTEQLPEDFAQRILSRLGFVNEEDQG